MTISELSGRGLSIMSPEVHDWTSCHRFFSEEPKRSGTSSQGLNSEELLMGQGTVSMQKEAIALVPGSGQ